MNLNQINPLYILLLSITLALISWFQLNQIKSDHNLNVKALYQTQKNSTIYANMEQFRSSNIKQQINTILKNPSYKDIKSTIDQTNNKLNLKLEGSTLLLDKILNKLLNKKLLINKLQIVQDKVVLEIQL